MFPLFKHFYNFYHVLLKEKSLNSHSLIHSLSLGGCVCIFSSHHPAEKDQQDEIIMKQFHSLSPF